MTFFTPLQIYVASCLGSPLAATWLMVRNHRALRQPERIRQVVWLGLAATAAVVAVALTLPDSLPVTLWPCVYSIGSYLYARRVLGADFTRAIGAVGQRGTWWRVIVISGGFVFVLFGVLFTLAMIFPGLFANAGQQLPWF